MEHTPAPWAFKIDEEDADDCGLIVGKDDESVCGFGNGRSYDNRCGFSPEQNNLTLILAAPELLDALKVLTNGLEWNIDNHPEIMNESDNEALEMAKKIIAKATGK